jgi:hypothetical protein
MPGFSVLSQTYLRGNQTEKLKEKLKKIVTNKFFLHIVVFLILLMMVILESRLTLAQLASVSGSELNVPYLNLIIQLIGDPSFQFKVIPGLLIAQIFSLPLYSVQFLFYIIYQLASGFFMYFFVYRFLDLVVGRGKVTERVVFSLLGGLAYMYFPYNIVGDNFPELFFIRALLPLCLLFFMIFIERRKLILITIPSLILTYMIIMDPRAILFVPPLVFLFVVLPRVFLSPGQKTKIAILLSFILSISFSFLLSEFTVTPRLSMVSIPTNIDVPFVTQSFRYGAANFLNTLMGLSFEGTNQTYVSSFSSSLLILAVFSFSILLLLTNRRITTRKAITYFVIPIFFAIIVFLFFVNFNGSPLFETLLFSVPSVKLPETIKILALQFRTPRFMNMTLALIYSVFPALSLSILSKFLTHITKGHITLSYKTKNFWLKARFKKKFLKKLSLFVLIGIFLFSVVSTVGVIVSNGSFLSGLVTQRTIAYKEVQQRLGNTSNYSGGFISVPYSDTGWAFSEPPVGMAESVLRYIYAYALDPSIQTSLLNRNQTQEIADILTIAGTKYLIVDGYLGDESKISAILNCSSSFTYSGGFGELVVYENNRFLNADLANPVFVLGGMETYNNLLSAFGRLSLNSSFAPVFMDGPINWNYSENLQSFGPIFSTPNKSVFDLAAPYLMNTKGSVVIAPSQYTIDYDPNNHWSPGFVSDVNQGVWTSFCSNLPNFDWDYSYNPNYGFAFTFSNTTIDIPFSIAATGSYRILARTMMHPENSSIMFNIDVSQAVTKTGWNISSSEFVWNSLGDFNLSRGSHNLNITNLQGSNAINLVLITPSSEIQTSETFVEDFYNVVGDVELLDRFAIFNNESSPSGETNFSLNPIQRGTYSMILELGNSTLNAVDGVKVILNNQTLETKVLSTNPPVVSVGNVSLVQGQQLLKILTRFNSTSDISLIIYGPEGSLASNLLSNKIFQPLKVNVTQILVKDLSANYNEYKLTFNASSNFMLVFPQIYTGTLRVSLDSPSNITYTTYPVYNVYTGIWFDLQNESSSKAFTVTLYTEEGRSFLSSSKTTLLAICLAITISALIDIAVYIRRRQIKQFIDNSLKNQVKKGF